MDTFLWVGDQNLKIHPSPVGSKNHHFPATRGLFQGIRYFFYMHKAIQVADLHYYPSFHNLHLTQISVYTNDLFFEDLVGEPSYPNEEDPVLLRSRSNYSSMTDVQINLLAEFPQNVSIIFFCYCLDQHC